MNKLISHKFGYDLSALTEYTEEQVLPLVFKSLFDSKTGTLFRHQTGIKYKEVINRMDTDTIIQDGTTCGFTPTGNVDFSQRDITVAPMKIDMDWCVNDLEKYWMQTQLTPGSLYNGIPFEQAFSEYQAGKIAEANEVGLWQSNTDTGGLYDGFLEIIDDSGLAINGNTGGITTGVGITVGNVRGIFDDIMEALPANLDSKTDLFIACGWDTFKKLIQALRDANNFYYNGVESNPYKTGELDLPGWGITVYAVHGLDGTNRIIAGRTSNFVIGTDLENDDEQFRFWVADDMETIRFKVRWKLGTQVAWPQEIIQFTLA